MPLALLGTAVERNEVERGLRLAKEYWLRTVQPHIAGRVIYGVELFVAERAYRHLLDAIEKAEKWNRLCVEKMDEAHLQVSMDVDLSAENFRRPEVPEMLFADNVKPEILAAIAAPLVKGAMKLTPTDAIRNAHKLLMAAERYIGTLPQKKEGIGGSIVAAFEEAFSTVTFAEIEASNRIDSGQLPLLPPLGQKKKGKNKEELVELAEMPLTKTAIKSAVRRFLHAQTPPISQEDYERGQQQEDSLVKAGIMIHLGSGRPVNYQEWQQRNQEEIDDCLKNGRISLIALCMMRLERFKNNSRNQQKRAFAREAKKADAKAKVPNTKLSKSAASSPPAAGKRQK